uniref:NXPE C-terminal domain-containing protein n=1 Tax=Branchiostoma floridae TaxID=7739 RepID=C3ZSC6_BRAFL|eukprot:XP_002588545.1 hypothetical protein BRAFLDRAFT_280610 [Branchiostoma floridae]
MAPETRHKISVKGLCFISLAAVLLYLLLVNHYRGNKKIMSPHLRRDNPKQKHGQRNLNVVRSAVHNHNNIISISRKTSASTTSLHLINNRDVYNVGETLFIKIVASDAMGRPKHYGEDLFLAKLYSNSPIQACFPGKITDYGNGTYLAKFLLSWPGNLSVSVKLLRSSEAVQVLRRVRDTFLDRRVTICNFVHENKRRSEWTKCAFSRNDSVNPRDVCDYSKPVPNATFYCERPPTLSCNSILECKQYGHTAVRIAKTRLESTLNVIRYFPTSNAPRQFLTCIDQTLRGEALPRCGPQLPKKTYEGFWFNDTWHSLRCNSRQFPPSLETYKCLQNKTFFVIGDSTGHQYEAFLKKLVGDIDTYLPDAMKEWEKEHNSIKIDFLFHTFPKNQGPPLKVKNFIYAADKVDSIIGGPDVVIIFSIWAHYCAEPIETYRSRVWGIRHAIERLLSQYPDTKVIWRTSNMREADWVWALENGNWHAYQLLENAKQILGDLNIFVMDVWDMSVCDKEMYMLHPEPNVIKNHIDLILSYICP